MNNICCETYVTSYASIFIENFGLGWVNLDTSKNKSSITKASQFMFFSDNANILIVTTYFTNQYSFNVVLFIVFQINMTYY